MFTISFPGRPKAISKTSIALKQFSNFKVCQILLIFSRFNHYHLSSAGGAVSDSFVLQM